MYNTESVTSGMVTGTQWDVMLNVIKNKTNTNISSASWGNILSNSFEYQGASALHFDEHYLEKFKEGSGTKSNSEVIFLTTAGASICEKYHLYDISGNAGEMIEESYSIDNSGNSTLFSIVGLNLLDNVKKNLLDRAYDNDYSVTNGSDALISFRVVLYIK